MEEQDRYIKALIELHRDLDRQGPGDAAFSRFIIDGLPQLPPRPRIADLGCGAGAGTLILADTFRSTVRAVDFSREFLDQLAARAKQAGLEDYIEIIERDIGDLKWDPASVDLLWSEGAAYNLGFKRALETWRPLVAVGGAVVISEMNYFSEEVAPALAQSLKNVYPDITTESGNVATIVAAGFEVVGLHRLPSAAWWDNYYDPLRAKISRLKNSADSMMQTVIRETEEEMALFEKYAENYGYTFYVMRAT